VISEVLTAVTVKFTAFWYVTVDHEDGDSKFFQKSVKFYHTSRRHIQDETQRIAIITSIEATNYFMIGCVAGIIFRNSFHKECPSI
jgi:hypothetical protein